ncbi:hypothetical protein [Roseisolibacter agri]|uniref:Lipoprotein n=1 Tax=Roseisolibacter agri TaxID=2014610 RepID=A0AA37V9T8_9BACT|nr:hypothetical protein [Roseisolibacter agri]GLC24748.1 hypothetical protein rosag_12610 [Roseisolibacter agri]
MRHTLTSVLGALALGALAACGDGDALTPTDSAGADVDRGGGIWAGNVAVESAPGAVVLGNNTTRPVGYAVYGREWVAAALWGPCVQRTGCPTLAVAERKTVRASEIPGIDATRREVVVYWWHLVDDRNGGLKPDSIRSVVARVGN